MISAAQVRGSLLGLAVGDALGAPFEGRSAQTIRQRVPTPARLLHEPPATILRYTDDTQMAIAVAEALADHDEPTPEDYAARYVEDYEPWRGYGGGAKKVIAALADGYSVHDAARIAFESGSYGNGAAMRVAAVGLCFADDEPRRCAQARRSAEPTHCHPIGIDGAVLIAAGTAFAARSAGSDFDAAAMWRELAELASTVEFRSKLETARGARDMAAIAALGIGIAAHESAVTALALLARFPDDFVAAVTEAVCLGGDCDTIAAMVGGMVGARVGEGALPAIWLERLEDGARGRTWIRTLSDRLAGRD